ncbi:MAG: YihY/virulence factor BrkB family protein [Candidatus Cyclobacteriaceae bacterium M2_1C_046]
MKKILKDIPYLAKRSFSVLQKNNPLLLASATAFFTVFSTTPIIVLLVNILSLYFKTERISTEIFNEVRAVFGESTAQQIETFVGNFREMGSSPWITVLGTVFLIFVATTLFNVIKQALNRIWNIRINPKRKFRHNLKERGKAFLIILLGGLLFLITLLLETTVGFLSKYLKLFIPELNTLFVQTTSGVISLIIVSVWFGILFRYLPDARAKWKVLRVGAVVTGILFTIGKYILGIFLVGGNIGNIFDASASIVLFLLFIFYSSMIMYFGAAFTLVYGDYTNRNIKPKKYAERFQMTAVEDTEKDKETVDLTKE